MLLKGSNDSTIVSTAKIPGRKLSIKTLVKQCVKYIKNAKDQIVYITHCNCEEDAHKIEEHLRNGGLTNPIEIYDYDLISGAHIGPRSLAVFYISEEEAD